MIMAKKEATEMKVEDKLLNLYKLQTTLSAIDESKRLRGELPDEVKDIEDEIAGLKTREEKVAAEVAEFQAAVAQKKDDIERATASVARYKQQLDDVKNNREYDTLTKEIEFQSLEIELCNKKIREAEETIAAKEAILADTRKAIEERGSDLEAKKSELDEIVAETRIEEEKLKLKAKDFENKLRAVDERLLDSFSRIRLGARNGVGIACVQRDACGGCFNKIPPQRQLDVKMHKKIIVCEYCGRILIDPELAGVKTDKPEEKKPKKTTRKKAKATAAE